MIMLNKNLRTGYTKLEEMSCWVHYEKAEEVQNEVHLYDFLIQNITDKVNAFTLQQYHA